MIKRSLLTSMFLLIYLVLIFSLFPVVTENIDLLANYEKITENRYSALYLNYNTYEIMVKNKESGNIFFTNPPQRKEYETTANQFNKKRLGSQIIIHYFTSGDDPVTWDSVHESVEYEQVSMEKIDQGIKINYLLGEEWDIIDYLPIMMSKEFYEQKILDEMEETGKIGENEKETIKENYWLMSLEKRDDAQDLRYTEISPLVDEKELFKKHVLKLKNYHGEEIELNIHGSEGDFPVFRKEDILEYILRELVEGLGYMELSEITHEDISVFKNDFYLLNNELFSFEQEELAAIIRKLGITPEDVIEQHLLYNIELPFRNIRLFEIPLIFKLDGKDLIVRIPVDEIYFPENILNQWGYEETLPLVAVDVLPFFEAGNKEDQGYMVIPDGSGALINLNNDKEEHGEYRKTIYGQDPSLIERERQLMSEQKIRMPIYGLKKKNKAYLAIIEEGDAFAELRAKVPNRVNSYNTVYPRFNILPYTNMTLTGAVEGGANVNVYQERMIEEDIKIRYKFLVDEEANYSGMAGEYRSYLAEKLNWKRLAEEEQLPFLLEIEGSFHEILPQFGLSRRTVLPLTTFSETRKITEKLMTRGIRNINILYRGWFSGGLHHYYPEEVSVEREVGGENELTELNHFLEDNKINFYPEINFNRIYENNLFDNFISLFHASRYLAGGTARLYSYNRATGRYISDKYSYLLDPKKLDNLVDNFLSDYNRLNIKGLAVSGMGNIFYSNFRRDSQLLIDRGQTIQIFQKQLNKINRETNRVMVRGGNIPALIGTDFVIEAPLLGGADNLIDRSIPLYQMVLHGYKNFSGFPFNMSDFPEVAFLKMIETGAIPYFRGSFRQSDLYQQSIFNENYSIYYNNWILQAEEVYTEANSVLKDLQNQLIISHEKLKKNVFRTVFEKGDFIIVNYNEEPVTVDEFVIDGYDFKLIEDKND